MKEEKIIDNFDAKENYPNDTKKTYILSNKDIAEFSEAFDLFDKDKNQAIDAEELKHVTNALGLTLTDDDIDQLMKEFDADKDGKINFAEFLSIMTRRLDNVDRDKELRACFNIFDKNKDGYIDLDELKDIMKTLSNIDDHRVEKMFQEADINGDQKITFDEFSNMMSSK